MGVALVIPAGGSGSRLGSDRPKQILEIAGQPVIAWAIAPFIGLVDQIVIACSEASRPAIATLAESATWSSLCTLVAGGADRQASVHYGLRAVSPSHDLVLVHDAARPLIDTDSIRRCIDALAQHRAAVVAAPCHATTWRAAVGSTTALHTLPRDELWLAQTPQGLHRETALEAFAQADAAGERCSDDVGVLAWAGHEVAIVPGPTSNLKVTTADDLMIAEALLAKRGQSDTEV